MVADDEAISDLSDLDALAQCTKELLERVLARGHAPGKALQALHELLDAHRPADPVAETWRKVALSLLRVGVDQVTFTAGFMHTPSMRRTVIVTRWPMCSPDLYAEQLVHALDQLSTPAARELPPALEAEQSSR